MIDYLIGKATAINENSLTIEASGVGFGLAASSWTLSQIEIGSQITIYTYLNVREDDLSLFGFFSKEEKSMFLRLISVSGIGPKIAVAILSGISPSELASLIIGGDFSRLSTIKGIGKKTAERIVLELKDKLIKEYGTLGLADLEGGVAGKISGYSQASEDAIAALIGMGFSKQEASVAVAAAASIGAGSEKITTEKLVLAALKGIR